MTDTKARLRHRDISVMEMVESNAQMAIDQRDDYIDSIASHAANVRDTLTDWGMPRDRAVEDAYYKRVAALLDFPKNTASLPLPTRPGETGHDYKRRLAAWVRS